MNNTLRAFTVLTVAIMLILSFGSFGSKNYNGFLPDGLDGVYFTEFYEGKQGKTYYLSDRSDNLRILEMINGAERTKTDSVSDIPDKRFVILIQISVKGSDGMRRRSLYFERGKEYFDIPYEKIYELPEGTIREIMDVYKSNGEEVKHIVG